MALCRKKKWRKTQWYWQTATEQPFNEPLRRLPVSLKHLFKGTMGDLISTRRATVFALHGHQNKTAPRRTLAASKARGRQPSAEYIQLRQSGKRQSPCRHEAAREKILHLVFHFKLKMFLLCKQFWPSVVTVCLQCDHNANHVHWKPVATIQQNKQNFCASLL